MPRGEGGAQAGKRGTARSALGGYLAGDDDAWHFFCKEEAANTLEKSGQFAIRLLTIN
jgi:hypothetical protein